MNYLQDPSRATLSATASGSPPASRTRPFTRALNIFYDKIKPNLRHLVDRSVLDALIRQLEGFHKIWIALTVPELAEAAGVSPWSASQALGRLAAAGIITRRAKKMRKSGRYIWEIALTDLYRVDSHASPATEPSEERLDQVVPPWGRSGGTSKFESGWPATTITPELDQELIPAAPPPEPEPEPTTTPVLQEPTQEVEPPFTEAPAERLNSPLRSDQKEALDALRQVGIDYHMARKLARTQSPDLVLKVVLRLKDRVGTVRNPAAWVVREIERGGYALPPASRVEEKRQAERAAFELRQQQAQEELRLQAEQQEQESLRWLGVFHQLSPERQRELEQLTRDELSRISPRLAKAPLELALPGPFRSKLVELLQAEAQGASERPAEWVTRAAGPTPRRGGYSRGRRTSPSFPLEEAPSG